MISYFNCNLFTAKIKNIVKIDSINNLTFEIKYAPTSCPRFAINDV